MVYLFLRSRTPVQCIETSYDQIYDEHIYMFSASSIQKIYKNYEMTLIDAIPQNTHGGSMRYIVGRRGNISNRLKKILYREKKENINNLRGCYKFKKNVENSKKKLIHKLLNMKKKIKKSVDMEPLLKVPQF